VDLLAFWGKSAKEDGWHPAICHMLDVGSVAEVLFEGVLSSDLAKRLLAVGGGAGSSARSAVAVLCALHDLGKVSPGFQKKRRDLFQPSGEGFTFSSADESNHGAVTAQTLRVFLREYGLSLNAAENIARALGGHHGSFPPLEPLSCGKGPWEAARREAVVRLMSVFGLGEVGIPLNEDAITPAWLMALAGLVSVSDWIGSDERFFPYAGGATLDLASYHHEARLKAERAIQEIGWIRCPAGPHAAAFGELFFDTGGGGKRHGWCPSPMQSLCWELGRQADTPFLMLIEAPTGSGKTEAALWVADRLASVRGDHGLYYALPTQATSNQMLERLLAFLRGRFPETSVPLHLLHGMASMNETFQELRAAGSAVEACIPSPTNVEQENETQNGTVVAQEWFCGRKRGLLSPFAVGTVDQALLAALTTRHFFVRLFGLAQKTVVVDEVHAYDTYMSTLLDRLLEWLSAMGSSVILLSATLPARRRRELVRAYTGCDLEEPEPSYPRVVVGSAGHVAGKHVAFEETQERVVTIISRPDDTKQVACLLNERLEGGGCAAWICNTVSRAQEAYRTLRGDGRFNDADLMLFHARYPVEDRLRRERSVLGKFGKKGDRPEKAVVVATQVIEQSLDLDFDFMVTDLAPVDLILQRAGRLHRHAGRRRPPGLADPEICWLAPSTDEGGIPAFGASVYVYEPYVLLRTWLLFQGQEKVRLPEQTESWVETIYGDDSRLTVPMEFQEALEQFREKQETHRCHDEQKAESVRVPSPKRSRSFFRRIRVSREDDAEYLTRLADPTVSIICVHENANGLSLTPDGDDILDLDAKPNTARVRRLLQQSIRVGNRFWYEHFMQQATPAVWRNVAILRSCHLACFRDREIEANGRRLRIDEELGLYEVTDA